MSHQLISRSPDLKRLRDEGYNVSIEGTYLVIRDVFHVTVNREIRTGTLISDLNLANDTTVRPESHVVYFCGDYPCHRDGTKITQIEHNADLRRLTPELETNFSFSNKPKDNYADYYQKMTTYISIICGPAMSLDQALTPKTFPTFSDTDPNSPFEYLDSASSRADINMASRKLALEKVAIIGLGGTGSYVLDFVAKTPVKEIHLFDDDTFLQHNAFRAPGAASRADLEARLKKVDYFRSRYSPMHKGIIAHDVRIDESNVYLLMDMDFAFLCLDKGTAKKPIVEALESADKALVDVGMGLSMVDESIIGVLRVTTSAHSSRDHIGKSGRISFVDDGDDDYAKNIQVADLNALNATIAVIKWKKLFGFYRDYGREHHSTYTLDTNMLLNDDHA